MQKRKFVNISINYSQNSLVYDELKEYVEKVAKENIKLLHNLEISHDTTGLFHAFDIDDSDYKFSVRVVNEGNNKTLLYGFYDNNKHIIIDNIFDNELLSLKADDANIVCDRLSFVIKRNLRNISPEIDSAWKAYEFLYKEACRFIKENQFDYSDFSIRTGSCIDLKLTNNYNNDSLYCRFNPLSYNFKYIDGSDKEIPFTSITPKLWAEEVFPKINIIGDFIKGNVERFQARINGNYDLKEKYPHFNSDDIIKEVNNRIQAQKELQTMNKIIWDFGNSLASRKIIEPEFIVNDLNLKATVNHKISVPVVHLCIEDSEIIFRDPLNNEIEFALEVKAKLQNELDTILKATFERMDNGLNKGGLIIDSSYEEPDFEY